MIRRSLSVLCWFLLVVIGCVTLPLAWVAANVADENGYVRLTEPMAQDSDLQRTVAAGIAGEVEPRIPVPDVLTADALTVAMQRLSNKPGFVDAWSETQRRTHRLVFARGRASDRLAVDVGPMAKFLAGAVRSDLAGLVPNSVILPVAQNDSKRVTDAISRTPTLAKVGIVAVLAAALGLLVFSRRSATGIVGIGTGLLAAGGLVAVIIEWLLPRTLDRSTTSTQFARSMRQALLDRVHESLNSWLLVLVVAGLVVTGMGLLLRLRR